MRRIIFFLFIITVLIVACKGKKQTTDKDVTAEQQIAEVSPDPARDSTEIRKVITDFYNWYNANSAKFQEYDLYSGIKKKDLPPYKINWDQVTKYQDFIRTSVPQLGEEFLSNQKNFFHQCDSAFKVNTEDELPYGFDYDWYTNSQDDAYYLVEQINRGLPWIVTRADNYTTIQVRGGVDYNGKKAEGTFITITMKKENGQWKIAKIGTE